MPRRYKGWKTTKKDVVEINRLITEAGDLVNAAIVSLTDDVGLDEDTARSLLPEVDTFSDPDDYYSTANVESLHDAFVNRADFDREKARLRRIITAGKGKPNRNVVSLTPDNANQLTSFYVDDEGNIELSQYARKEMNMIRRVQNQKRKKRLESYGIEFTKEEVLDPVTLKPMRDEYGHKITVDIPASPMNLERYQEVIQYQPELGLDRNKGGEGLINMYGDLVDVPEIEYHNMTMHEMRESVNVDAKAMERTARYFDNYKTLVDTTMPTSISDEIDGYIREIGYLPYSEQEELYEFIQYGGDDAGSIEYLYWDTTTALPQKMANILNFWRSKVAPKLGMEEREEIDLVDVQNELIDYGYTSNGLHPIFAEYQRRRKDEPKGRWRKEFRNNAR